MTRQFIIATSQGKRELWLSSHIPKIITYHHPLNHSVLNFNPSASLTHSYSSGLFLSIPYSRLSCQYHYRKFINRNILSWPTATLQLTTHSHFIKEESPFTSSIEFQTIHFSLSFCQWEISCHYYPHLVTKRKRRKDKESCSNALN